LLLFSVVNLWVVYIAALLIIFFIAQNTRINRVDIYFESTALIIRNFHIWTQPLCKGVLSVMA